jgi:hypothetical protein
MENNNDLFCFLKFGKREHIERLYKLGEVFFNSPQTFNESKHIEQGDSNEGAEWIENNQITKIEFSHPTLGSGTFKVNPNSPSRMVQYNHFFLSFSLYAVTLKDFENKDTHKIDERILKESNWECALLIKDPIKLINSINLELKANNQEYDHGLVEYRDLGSTGRHEITPFKKKIEHAHQNEFRIITNNSTGLTKSLLIGSIEDYSILLKMQDLKELEWKVLRREGSS